MNRGLSQAGQGTFLAGLLLLAGRGAAGTASLTGVFIAMMAAAAVCGLPAGALADRMGAPRALVAGAIGRAAVIAAALFVPANPVSLAAVAFGYSAVSQLFSPAEMALVSAVSSHRPAGMHAALVGLQHVGQGFGLVAIVPITLWLGGPTLMFATALAIYVMVIATSTLLAVQVPNSGSVGSARQAFSFAAPFRYFARWSTAGYAGLLLAFGELLSKSLLVAVPVYFSNDLHLSNTTQVMLIAPGVVGVIAGLVWSGRFLHVWVAPNVLRVALLVSAVAVVALAGLGNVVARLAEMSDQGFVSHLESGHLLSVLVAMPVGLLLGICFSLTPIAGRAILSATAPEGQQGRVFAIQGTFTDVLCILPLALSGMSTEFAGARTTFILIGGLGLGLFALMELTWLGQVRHAHRRPLPSPV